jgi:hypothetical protein
MRSHLGQGQRQTENGNEKKALSLLGKITAPKSCVPVLIPAAMVMLPYMADRTLQM